MRSGSHKTEPMGSPHPRFAARLGRSALALSLLTLVLVGIQPPIAAASSSFHTMCGPTNLAPDDPIVYPNQPGASHLHQFFGNTTTDARSTLVSLLRGGTACDNEADTAAYWIPAMISTSGQVVQPDRVSAYYYKGDVGRSPVAPFPTGLKILAGGDTHNLRVAGYACGEGMPESSVPLNCGRGTLRAVVAFPSCWDGSHTDSADHRSHMAYPTGRGCPSGYSVRVPKLVIHVRYPVSNGQGYRLSSDAGFHTTNGMSLHADFFNAWDQATLVQLVEGCLNSRGGGCHS